MTLATTIGEASQSYLPLGEAARGMYEAAIQWRPDPANKDFWSVYVHLKDL